MLRAFDNETFASMSEQPPQVLVWPNSGLFRCSSNALLLKKSNMSDLLLFRQSYIPETSTYLSIYPCTDVFLVVVLYMYIALYISISWLNSGPLGLLVAISWKVFDLVLHSCRIDTGSGAGAHPVRDTRTPWLLVVTLGDPGTETEESK